MATPAVVMAVMGVAGIAQPPSPSTRMAKDRYFTVVTMKRPQHQRQRALGCYSRSAFATEDGLEGVEGAAADIAEHNAKCRQTEKWQPLR